MLSIFQHPGLSTTQSRLSFAALILLRSIFFCLFIFLSNTFTNLGTSPYFLSAGAVAGVVIGSWLSFVNLNALGLASLGVVSYLLWIAGYYSLEYLFPGQGNDIFWLFAIGQQMDLFLIVFYLTAGSTCVFWRLRTAVTFELLGLLALSVFALSSHRNYHFDMPKLINTLAWDYGKEPLSLLVIAGATIVILILLYLFFATIPSKPVAAWKETPSTTHRMKLSFVSLTALLLTAAATVGLISNEIYKYFRSVSLTRLANGVGQENREGMSPLGFHSALGGTNQPSALVRLEGDYAQNPFVPMLYLRESALSSFNGRELTLAKRIYDQDVSATHPREAYVGKEDPRLLNRMPVVQSIYLLSDHKDAFAIDYPVSIKQLKNPNPDRFKSTYRAYSMAPAFKLEDLERAQVGDPEWSKETWEHYLEPHTDERYAKLAAEVTAGVTNPVQRAKTIADFLSEKAIYTLTPNHNIKPTEDPVAPFLFGDMRGYCVHFSHATVYMLRSLGVPARIGTGYLTDLSQSRDGHILLRMSDRHAWAEIYVAGYGWIPFDTHPAQVENHADSQVDNKLLEELMGMLDPGEEILPPDILKDEPNIVPNEDVYKPDVTHVLAVLILIGLFIGLRKLYLWYGWMIPGSPAARLKRSYVAVAALLHDLGYQRELGETRDEFRRRISNELGIDTLRLTGKLNRTVYSDGRLDIVEAELAALRQKDLEAFSEVPFGKMVMAALNPSSVISSLWGPRW